MTLARRARYTVVAMLALLLFPVSPAGASVEGRLPSQDGAPLSGAARTEVAGTRWLGKIVVGGGLVAAPGGFMATRDLFVYDPANDSWARGPELPGPRDHAALGVMDSKLYLVGGYSASAGLGAETREVWRLDALTGPWIRVADLQTPRGALAVAVARGYLFALGGVNAGAVLATTEWYDPDTDVWQAGPDMSIKREHFGATSAGERIYAVGGRNPVNTTSVESLAVGRSGPRPRWRDEPALRFARGGNSAATAGGRVCTAGGEEPAGTIGPVECLSNDRWERIADLRVPRHGLAVVGVGRSLHVISGGPQPGATYSTTHEVFSGLDR